MYIKDIEFSDLYAFEGQFCIKLFGEDIQIHIEQGSNIQYAEQCVMHLNFLNEDIINGLCEASIRYCNEFLEDIGESTIPFTKTTDVLDHITPGVLVVPIPQNGDEPIIDLELGCTWEVEHGMQWIIRGDKVLYVGPYEGVDPWGNCDLGKSWNYV